MHYLNIRWWYDSKSIDMFSEMKNIFFFCVLSLRLPDIKEPKHTCLGKSQVCSDLPNARLYFVSAVSNQISFPTLN